MFSKIIIVVREGLTLGDGTVNKIKNAPKESEIKFLSLKEISKQSLADAELIVTIGGDGTFVKTANLIEDSMIIGVNANPKSSEGALTDLNIEDIDRLKDIFTGKFKTTLRQRAKITLNGKVLNENATNEVFIGAASQFHTSLYKIKFNGKEEYHKSSGVIISTGTGSKAWFLTAGGKPFGANEEKIAFEVREPYIGERVFKPKILKGEIKKGEKLIFKGERYSGGILAVNDTIYSFNMGDTAEIELSDKPLKAIGVLEK